MSSATHDQLSLVVVCLLQPMFAQGVATHTFTFYLFLYGGVGHVFVGAFFLPGVDFAHMPLKIIPILIYVIVVASFIAFSLFVYATRHLPASISSLGITCQSVFSPVLGAFFLGEVVTWENAVGGVAIAAGIVIVVLAKGRESVAAAAAQDAAVCTGKDVEGWHEARHVDMELMKQQVTAEVGEKDAASSTDGNSDDEAEDMSLHAGSSSDTDSDVEGGGEWDEDGYVERGGRVLSEERANINSR